ncbi:MULTISPECIES: CidA/LrgA family protein [Stenotrophomonas]|uniref:CidA/LrgA family protein n=1 Tax=Stenotrophomonas TaxID=40323 RepID=UPI00081BCC96|nr:MULTISPECIES: CidA/LrgA family protein [Stenotrophomonas]
MEMLLLSLRRCRVGVKRWLRRSTGLQIGALVGVWLLADVLMRQFGVPVPGGIVGLFVLLLAFALQWLSPRSFSRGAQWLLAEMLLFFVPAAMILLDNRQMFGWLGIKLLAVVVGGTVLVMAVTALTVEGLFRWSQRNES